MTWAKTLFYALRMVVIFVGVFGLSNMLRFDRVTERIGRFKAPEVSRSIGCDKRRQVLDEALETWVAKGRAPVPFPLQHAILYVIGWILLGAVIGSGVRRARWVFAGAVVMGAFGVFMFNSSWHFRSDLDLRYVSDVQKLRAESFADEEARCRAEERS